MDIFECKACKNKSYDLKFLYDNCPKCGKLHWHKGRIILAAIWVAMFLSGAGLGAYLFIFHHG